MYCIYVSNNGENIQKVVNNNQIIISNDIQTLMPMAKDIKNKYPELNVSIIDEDTYSIVVDYQ